MRKVSVKDKKAVKLAKKEFKLSKATEGHESRQLELMRAIYDGVKHCNYGSLKVSRL